MIQVVLFDFHNTLATCDGWLDLEIRTLPGLALHWLAVHGLVNVYRPEMEPEAEMYFKEVRQQVRDSGVELSAVEGTSRVLDRLGIVVEPRDVELAVAALEQACLAGVEMVVGADTALEMLRDKGYRLGVVSSAGYPPFVEMALEELGLRPFFSEVVTSTGEGLYKSDPEIFRRAVSRLGAKPDEAVHIGDHARFDVQAAGAAGLHTIWFAPHAERTARLHGADWTELQRQGAEADAVVTSMLDVPAAVERVSEE